MTEDEFMDKWNPTRQGKIIPCMLRVWEGKATVEQVWDEMDRFFTAVANGTADLEEITDFDSDIDQIDVRDFIK
jgi:hypothetical protein